MGSTPQDSATILLNGTLAEEQSIGIDSMFFGGEPGQSYKVKGIKLIPKGLHLFHISTAEFRKGRFLKLAEGDLVVVSLLEGSDISIDYWIDKNGSLVGNEGRLFHDKDGIENIDYAKHLSNLPDIYPYLINYDRLKNETEIKRDVWVKLIDSLDIPSIAKIVRHSSNLSDRASGQIATEDSTRYELEELKRSVEKSGKYKGKFEDIEHLNVLEFEDIDFKNTSRPGASIEQITKDYLDKTWIITNKYGPLEQLEKSIIVELQLSFVLGIILCNPGCASEWLRLLKVLLNCYDLIMDKSNRQFVLKFVETLKLQLTHIPTEFTDNSGDYEFFKVNEIKSHFRTFLRTITDNGDVQVGLIVNSIMSLLNDKYDLKITASLDDDDGNESDEDGNTGFSMSYGFSSEEMAAGDDYEGSYSPF